MTFLNCKKSKVTSNLPPILMEVEPLSKDKLSILPEEIVEIILGYLEEPTDVANVSRASSVCERILEPSKSTWLFHKIFQKINIYLNRQDVCNCRLVCTMWKNGVDGYLGNEPDKLLQRQFTFAPRSTTSITGFCMAMKSHRDRNPFPTRAVDFGKIWDGRCTAGYWVHVLRFLGRFGEHISTVHFDFQSSRMDLFVIILRQCLCQMRNLRRLQISWKFNSLGGNESKMREELEERKFPFLGNLEHIKLIGVFNSLFYQKFVLGLYAGQLKTLNVSGKVL